MAGYTRIMHYSTSLMAIFLLVSACDHDNGFPASDSASVVHASDTSTSASQQRSCPSLRNYGAAYMDPCEIRLTLRYTSEMARDYQSRTESVSSDYSLELEGEARQLYPPGFFIPNRSRSESDYLTVSGQVQVAGVESRTPANPVALDKHGESISDVQQTRTQYRGRFSGPVDTLLIERFERRLDDPSSMCLTISSAFTVSGEGVTTHTLTDQIVISEASGPPWHGFRGDVSSGVWRWGRTTSGLGPHEIILCEGLPPSGDEQDCEADPRSYYGNSVCASDDLVDCDMGDCQVDFGRGGRMIWYGLTANEDRTLWTLQGGVSIADPAITLVHDTRAAWSLHVSLNILERELSYE